LFFFCIITSGNKLINTLREYFGRLVYLIPPFKEFVKINCDGTFTFDERNASARDVVKDCEGRFFSLFSTARDVVKDCEGRFFVLFSTASWFSIICHQDWSGNNHINEI